MTKEKDNKENEQKTNTSEPSERKKKGILFSIISLISFIMIPLLLSITIIFTLLTTSSFYTSILKNIDLISTFVHVKKWQIEEDIKEEIEKDVKLEQFRKKHNEIKNLYEEKRDEFNILKRITEYKKIKKQRKELKNLSWKRAPDIFKDKSEFNKYKEEELTRLERVIVEIKEYRDNNDEKIEKAEDELEDIEDDYEDAQDTLHSKEKDAKEIVMSHKNSFIGKIYSDIELISPFLSKDLNSKLIDIAVKGEIEKLIQFFCTYRQQKLKGNIYSERFTVDSEGIITDLLKVKLPEMFISLFVEEEINGILQKRHLFSQIFVDKIEKINNLNNRDLFIKMFKLTESGLAESFGRLYLKKINLTIDNGIIRIKNIKFEGYNARVIESIMIGVTVGYYLKYIFPAIVLLLIVAMFASNVDKKRKYQSIKRILIYPSILMIIICISFILLSGSAISFFPDLFQSSFIQMYAKNVMLIISSYLLVPLIFLYCIFAVFGFVIRKGAFLPK